MLSRNGRYTGLIVGISDADPVRWPGSKWRCLLVSFRLIRLISFFSSQIGSVDNFVFHFVSK